MGKESKYVVFGLLAGAALGATLGILFAPQSGKETRKTINRKAKKAQRDIAEYVDKVRGNAGNSAADILENVGNDLNSKAKRAAEDVRQSAN